MITADIDIKCNAGPDDECDEDDYSEESYP